MNMLQLNAIHIFLFYLCSSERSNRSLTATVRPFVRLSVGRLAINESITTTGQSTSLLFVIPIASYFFSPPRNKQTDDDESSLDGKEPVSPPINLQVLTLFVLFSCAISNKHALPALGNQGENRRAHTDRQTDSEQSHAL